MTTTAPAPPSPSADSSLHWTGPLMVLAGGICIGFAPIGLRMGVNAGDLGPQAIAFWRYLIATPMLFLLVLLVQRRLPARPNRYIIAGGAFFASNIALWHWALTLTTVANATFIVSIGNVSAGLVAWLFLKEKPSTLWFIAFMIAIAGAAGLALGGEVGGKGDLRGDALAMGAAVLVSFYVLCSKIARRTLDGLEAIFWLTLVEVCVGGLIMVVAGEKIIPSGWAGLKVPLFLAIVVQIMGQGFIITGLGRTSAAVAGVMILMQPVVAAAISWQMFDESLTALQLIGAATILVAVWLSQQRPKPKPAT